MIYSRCKCGHHEYYDSGMPPQPCQTCEKCGSTLSSRKDGHVDPEPHDWKEEWAIHRGSLKWIRRCRRCYTEEILQDGPERPEGR